MVPSQKKTYDLHELLYYDIATMCNGDLRKGLTEYRLLVSALKLTIQHLENQDLEKFDALVGENACQVRAIKIAIIASKNQTDFQELNERIDLIQEKINKLLSNKQIQLLMTSHKSMQVIIEEHDLNIVLTSDEMFAIQSFMLTVMKESQPELLSPLSIRDKSSPKKLKQIDPEISFNFADSTVSKLRRLLSEATVRFVRESAWSSEDPGLTRMVSPEFTMEHNTWPYTPTFWTYKAVLDAAHKKHVPIILHAKFLDKSNNEYIIKDELKLFFKPVYINNARKFIRAEPETVDLNKPACVVQGVVCLNANQYFCKTKWEEDMSKYSILDIILACAADHRQLFDPNISVPVHNLEYERYRIMAKQQGFSIDNPTTFFINHVYALQAGKMLSFADNNLLHCSINT